MGLRSSIRNLFGIRRKSKSDQTRSQDFGLGWIVNYGDGSIRVSEESSLSFSAVFSCVDSISSDLAMLPFNVYENTDSGKKIATDHPQYFLLKSEPHSLYTSFEFRKTLLTYALLWGNGYAKINRNERTMQPVSYRLLHPWGVTPFLSEDEVWYKNHKTGDVIPAIDMIHIKGFSTSEDGLKGKSVISIARETIRGALSGNKLNANFRENGAHLGGVIHHPGRMSPDAHTRLTLSFRENYGGIKNIGKVPILEEGAKFHPIGMSFRDAQFLEVQKYSVNEICRIFRVPPHKVMDLERATFSNIEHQGIEYVTQALMPWAKRTEQEFDRKSFRVADRGKFYTKHELKALLRGDNKSRGEFYQLMIQTGVMSINEVRALEDMNPVEGGDVHFIQLNTIPLLLAPSYYESQNKKEKQPA